jgi:hypothetical protein
VRFAISAAMSWLFPTQVDLARGLGADVVIAEGADATQSIEAVRHFFGGGEDTAIVAGDLSLADAVDPADTDCAGW